MSTTPWIHFFAMSNIIAEKKSKWTEFYFAQNATKKFTLDDVMEKPWYLLMK
jgi:hypothetical protein